MTKWITNLFKSDKAESDVTQCSFLLDEMRKIRKSYEERGLYCYELYTLMYTISIKENIHYDMIIHCELMSVIS